MGVAVSRAVLDRSGIDSGEIDQVLFGHARQAGCGPNPARQVSVGAGVSESVPALTVNAACGSGLKSIALAADAIRLGQADCVLAGGMESMTRVPFMLDRGRTGYRLGHAPLVDGMYRDGFMCPLADMVMGETAEVLAREYDVTRKEQDAWAAMSQNRAEAATAAGRFVDEIVPVTARDDRGRDVICDADEHPRAGVTAASLAKLPAVFDRDGSVTAGNASGITDGAAAVIVTSAEKAAAMGVSPIAVIRDFVAVGVEPRRMGIGPVPAVRQILKRGGLSLRDISLIELNEAFAAQVIACQRELEFDAEKVNRSGGAISLGHPIGCTGTRIVVTLLNDMRRTQSPLALATLCVSGGMGMAMLLEAV